MLHSKDDYLPSSLDWHGFHSGHYPNPAEYELLVGLYTSDTDKPEEITDED